jgi:hypothetical protein
MQSRWMSLVEAVTNIVVGYPSRSPLHPGQPHSNYDKTCMTAELRLNTENQSSSA